MLSRIRKKHVSTNDAQTGAEDYFLYYFTEINLLLFSTLLLSLIWMCLSSHSINLDSPSMNDNSAPTLDIRAGLEEEIERDEGIILFLHMHKAGGTTVNYVFKNKKKSRNNHNGNPWNENKIIEFWNYDNDHLQTLYNKWAFGGVEFVSMEWNFFSRYDELDLSRFRMITCIRDPFKRFQSNWNRFTIGSDKGEYKGSYTDKTDIRNWHTRLIEWTGKTSQTFLVNFNVRNYYVAMMNGFGNSPEVKINRAHLEIAKKRLLKFDAVMILEVPESFALLKRYGVTWHNEHRNVGNRANDDIHQMTEEDFFKENALDYEFYEYAKQVSQSMRAVNGLP